MKSLEIWSEMKDEASTFGKSDTDASVFLNAYIDPFELWAPHFLLSFQRI